jgi:hypothetical protein
MNHIFCTECGSKIEYSYSKPKFCHNCGGKCGGGVSRIGADRKSEVEDEPLAEDETQIDELPIIHGGLQVDIESHGNNVFSFESLVGQEDSSRGRVRRKSSRTIENFINDRKGR